MSKTLKDEGYDAAKSELDDIAKQRVKNLSEAELDALQLALGTGGIFDPSPAADATNAGISFARGDYFGFVLDGISAFPYVGDAVSKPVRGAQMSIRSWSRGRKLAGFAKRGDALVESIKGMRTKAADAVKEAKRKLCVRCNNAYGTMTPTKGKWSNPADPGNGKYSINGNDYVWKEGYPDFEHPDMAKYLAKDGKPAAVQIEMTGKRTHDDVLANIASGRGNTGSATPSQYTWHHGDDGSTMYLVRSDHHDALVPHSGGHSIAKDPLF